MGQIIVFNIKEWKLKHFKKYSGGWEGTRDIGEKEVDTGAGILYTWNSAMNNVINHDAIVSCVCVFLKESITERTQREEMNHPRSGLNHLFPEISGM